MRLHVAIIMISDMARNLQLNKYMCNGVAPQALVYFHQSTFVCCHVIVLLTISCYPYSRQIPVYAERNHAQADNTRPSSFNQKLKHRGW